MIDQNHKDVQRASEKAEELRQERKKELAGFISQNEKLQEQLKELWVKSGRFNLIGYFSTIELFNHCHSILEEQTEIIRKKQNLKENPYAKLLDILQKILYELMNAMRDFQVVDSVQWADASSKTEAHKKFLTSYYKNLPFIRRLIIHTVSGTAIATDC